MSDEKSIDLGGYKVIAGSDIVNINYAVDRLSKAHPGDVQEIAASQIQLLTSYYDLVLGQARRSFRWALIAAGIGLGFFLASLAFLLLMQLQNVATVSLISGALIEVISAINFYLYKTTSDQLANFHTRLDLTQRFLLANSICDSLEGDIKSKARYEIIKTITGLEYIRIREGNNPKVINEKKYCRIVAYLRLRTHSTGAG
jgi:hypothetical protein